MSYMLKLKLLVRLLNPREPDFSLRILTSSLQAPARGKFYIAIHRGLRDEACGW